MASQLVLVRHAKTQARRPGGDDLSRELTDAGRRSAAATLPARMAHLRRELLVDAAGEPTRRLELWTSPATRAMQTADVVARGLDDVRPQVRDSLYGQDVDAFLAELAETLVDGPACVVAVGHNPFLEETVRRLTGQRLKLGKAAVVVLELPDVVADASDAIGLGAGTPDAVDRLAGSSRLLFFQQGPDWRRWQTLTELEEALAKAAQRIEDAAGQVVTASDDPESLHRYRVTLRVARSLVAFVSPWQRRAQGDRLARLLRGLQGPTSRPREFDVLCGQASAEGADVDDGRPTSVAGFAGACALGRASARADFLDAFVSPKTQKALERTLTELREIRWRDAVEGRGLDRSVVRARLDGLVDAYRQDLALVDFADAEATHDVRKRSKQLRYVARELGGLLGQGATRVMEDAEADQGLLGELCDARVNAALARDLLDRRGCDDAAGEAYVREQEAEVERLLEELRGRRG